MDELSEWFLPSEIWHTDTAHSLLTHLTGKNLNLAAWFFPRLKACFKAHFEVKYVEDPTT